MPCGTGPTPRRRSAATPGARGGGGRNRWGCGLVGGGPLRTGPARRAGSDRRARDVGRPEGDRRASIDRRIGPRRLRGKPGEIDIVAAARRAREYADAAFSRFKVGAALETGDGTVFTGCNIENATYGLTICAERVAMVKALSDGHHVFTRIAIVADPQHPSPPGR